jgi:hypothetical protein
MEALMIVIERRFGPMGSAFVKYGIGYGAAAAMVLSYAANKSILWMLIDGWLSWIYIIYFALFKA